ncbi:MAG: glycosyltransferase [Patescibacteria group bacterium]|nr:glycosyltransferase [Patescibacteria group bacterium]
MIKLAAAAIVAAYNEEPTIGQIVKTLAGSNLFRDVVVISDGSTDATAEKAVAAGATLVHQLPWKHGKGAAMMHGVAHTDAPILFFLDADLKGLEQRHLESLLLPVLKGECDMSVGLRDRGAWLTALTKFLPLISGERVLNRKIFEDIPDKYLRGFMVETALNYYCRIHKLKVCRRKMHGLNMRKKMQKVGIIKGVKEYVVMAVQMLRAVLILRYGKLKGDFS